MIPTAAFYQFRLAFERTQAKGSFKVMSDMVAEAVGCGHHPACILSEAGIQGQADTSKVAHRCARTFRGPVVLGIRDVSRLLEFRASYTLVEHAPADSMDFEIKPYALAEIEKVRAAFEGRQFESLLELLGLPKPRPLSGSMTTKASIPSTPALSTPLSKRCSKPSPRVTCSSTRGDSRAG